MGNNRYMNIEDDDLDQAAGFQQDEEYYEDDRGVDQQYAQEPSRFSSVRSEAVKRIQKAKLYETLLSHSLFAPGSAEAEVLEEVEAELKAIIEEKLEELLGMRSSASRAPVPVQLPFDADQLEALIAVANRALRRIPALGSTPTPAINPVQTAPVQPEVHQPEVQQPAIIPAGRPQRSEPVVRRQAPQRAAQQPPQQGQARKPSRRRPTGNTSEKTGRELSQAASRRRVARPMPSQDEIDAMNARQADRNSKAPKVIPVDDQQDPNAGMSSAHVGALLAKVLQGQGG